jgi:hypothetical protein
VVAMTPEARDVSMSDAVLKRNVRMACDAFVGTSEDPGWLILKAN